MIAYVRFGISLGLAFLAGVFVASVWARLLSPPAAVALLTLIVIGAATAIWLPSPPDFSNRPAAKPADGETDWLAKVSDAVLIADTNGVIGRGNAATRRVLGYEPGTLVGRRVTSLVHDNSVADVETHLRGAGTEVPAENAPVWRLRRADGSWLELEATTTDLRDDPAVRGIAIALRAPRDKREPLTPEALRDPLTGMATRDLLRDRADHALARAHRLQLPVAILVLDFEDFRGASSTRLTVDQIEKLTAGVAMRLLTCLRASDTASRIEGTRFGVLLEDMAEENNFVQVADRIREAFDVPVSIGGIDFLVSPYMGIASAVPEDTPDDLIRHADVALRAARRQKRGAMELFDPRQHSAALGHQALEDDLRRAIERQEFSLVYQPIVILRSRRIAGVEALVRWHHRERGLIPAAAFVPVAEETGLIVPLGRWVMHEACRQVKHWQDAIGPGRTLTVTVNVTPRQLLHGRFVDDVASALHASGLEPHRLVLEIAEGALARNVTDALARLRQVRALGVRLAIDDYGSRSTSLGDPADIPVDILKIDRAFISQVTRRPEEHAATRAIVALGKLKRLRTVAEGIENEDQLVELLRFRCDYGQGTLFSEPVSAEGFFQLLKRD